MQIVHVTSAHPSHDVRIFEKYCRSLAAAGKQVSLIYGDKQDRPPEHESGVDIVAFRMPVTRIWRILLAAFRVRQRTKTLQPSIIHLHDPETFPFALMSGAHRVVLDFHEDVPKQVMSKEWIPVFLRKPMASLMRYVLRRLASHADAVVCAVPEIAIGLGLDEDQYVLLRNFPERLTTKREHACHFPVQLVYAGLLSKTRGLELMMSLAESNKIKLHLAGRFKTCQDHEFFQAHEARAAVVWHGNLDRDAVWSLYGKCDIGLCLLDDSPNHVDSIPTKFLEYMAAGMPVVVSDVLRFPKVFSGVAGVIHCPYGDMGSVQNAIALLSDEKIYREASAAVISAVGKGYVWQDEFRKALHLYAELGG